MASLSRRPDEESPVQVRAAGAVLEGNLGMGANARGLVLFAHGSGSGRHSSRNRFVAEFLRREGLATLLFDLLTVEEERADAVTGHLRFNIPLLAERVAGVTDWLPQHPATRGLPVGYFGASTGAAAAVVAAAGRPQAVRAVVSRGGRPDLAADALPRVEAPTLLIVGGNDGPVIGMNRMAFEQLGTDRKELVIVPGASHLFEEPGTLEQVAGLASEWFTRHLGATDCT